MGRSPQQYGERFFIWVAGGWRADGGRFIIWVADGWRSVYYLACGRMAVGLLFLYTGRD
jgi:hypothetical protein